MKIEWAVMIAAGIALATAVIYMNNSGNVPAGGGVPSVKANKSDAAAPPGLLQLYADYNQTVNNNKGTRGVQYYPCPSGYRCRDLLIPQLHLDINTLAWDHCRGDDESCLIMVTDFLILSGIDDVEPYLTARKKGSE